MAKRRRSKKWVASLLVLVVVFTGIWFVIQLQPVVPTGKVNLEYVRFDDTTRLGRVLQELERRKLIKSSFAVRVLAFLEKRPTTVKAGTYNINAGMSAQQVLRQLQKPINIIIRFPETNWANRTAHLLAQYRIVDADEYMRLFHDPNAFANDVSFPLPATTLEGYLYPKKYAVAPLDGAQKIIKMQLKEFEKVVWNGPERPSNLQRTLTLASLVQLESGVDEDRAMIAGVIENRIKKKMPLQIDSTILYALQKWRRLTFKDYRAVKSPYNTYMVLGLPPGPICSPDEKDILAAMHPAKHNYLYYVALPNGHSLFAETYSQHLKNIGLRKAAIAVLKAKKQ